MSVEAKVPLGFHEFFRYAIPGYIYLLVFFLPILTTPLKATLEPSLSLDPLLSSALLVVSGPVIGFVIFQVYYLIFTRYFYGIKKTPPFPTIERLLRKELSKQGLAISTGSEMEIWVRALEDLLTTSDPLKKTSNDLVARLAPSKERIRFLFSSFHSLGATAAAILLGMVSWGVLGIANYVLQGYPSVIWPKEIVVFLFFLIIWLVLSVVLLWQWRYRKNLAIREEALLASMDRQLLSTLIGEAVETYKAEHNTCTEQEQRQKAEFSESGSVNTPSAT